MNKFQWIIRVIPGWFLTIFCFLFCWLIAIFVKSNGYLPTWLGWFQTPDAPAIGDAEFIKNQMKGSTNKWWCCLNWLMRNPAQGWDARCGFVVLPNYICLTTASDDLEWTGDYVKFPDGTIGIADNSNKKFVSGSRYRTLVNGGVTYWEWWWVKQWGSHFSRIKFGWDLDNPVNRGGSIVGLLKQIEFTINPWMSI